MNESASTNPDATAAAPSAFNPYARSRESFREPPVGPGPTLRHLGPGMILVGSIVGSGELIMTTKLGAQAGFVLLWFVLLSCVIKTIVQAELARHTISSGKTFLEVFNGLPGPAARRPVWLTLEWMTVLVVACLAALGAYTWFKSEAPPDLLPEPLRSRVGLLLIGAVAVTIVAWALLLKVRYWRTTHLVAGARDLDRAQRRPMNWFLWFWMPTQLLLFINGGAILGGAGQALQLAFPTFGEGGARFWAVVVAAACAAVLLSGRYHVLERFSIGMVATFTLITIVCAVLLQWTGYAITPADVKHGLSVALPDPLPAAVVLTALAMYAGTGIGTNEMMSYTYWCVEKGYARNTGSREPGDDWPRRARGWIRVMYADVLLTMVVYTISTVCFYFLGAAILYPDRDPDGTQTLAVLQGIYTESLGTWAATLFVVGGFIVLFSTVVSGVAGGSRILADALCVMGIIDRGDYSARLRFIRIFVVVSLTIHSLVYSMFENPPMMLMISSMISVILYPIMGLGTIYLRYRDVDPRIAPGAVATLLLWISGLALVVISPGAAMLALAIKRGWIVLGV